MAFDEFKYRIMMGILEMAGQGVSSVLLKPNHEEESKIRTQYYSDAKGIARQDEEKRKKIMQHMTTPTPPQPSTETNDLTTTKIEGGTACLPCIPPDTYIIANPNNKQIQELAIGDKVLDQLGKWTQIKTIYNNSYKGIVYDIFVKYQNTPLTVTPEHPILVTRIKPCPFKQGYCTPGKHTKLCEHCTVKYFSQYTPKFMKPIELFETEWKSNYIEDKLFLMTPRVTEIKDVSSIELKEYATDFEIKGEYIRKKITRQYKKGKKTIKHQQLVGRPIKNHINVDYDFMKLIGFYLAEGHSHKYNRGGAIRFSFGKHEKEYIDFVKNTIKKIFDISPSIKEKKTGTNVEAYSIFLYDLFSNLFGTNSHNKTIPKWILYLPHTKQKALIEGYYKGDGYIRKGKYNNVSCVSVSKKLITMLHLILIRQGISTNYRVSAQKNTSIDKRIIYSRGNRHILDCWGESAVKLIKLIDESKVKPWTYRESDATGLDNNYLYLPIKKIRTREYDGNVMNIETESNTYVANGFITHNCSRDHLSTVSGALSEAIRFSRKEGISHPEVARRLGLSLDELNMLERIDLSPEETVQLKGQEKQLAEWGLNKSRELRHKITTVQTHEDLERVAADAASVRTEFMRKLWGVVTVDGSISKLCKGLKDDEYKRCVDTINTVLKDKEEIPP